MEQLSHDYSFQSESRRDGVLESASRRVRMIFSVMASPNRIDILRILNSKGPLTYSELKSLAGFKSKKESGKFAYHLRKLLRQSLVALNKPERRYTITNLGKLVLSLARQIEERSIVESGKMYVRTSQQSIEEFNAHKIIQSLVREANMPLEQAHKITEEVENKIYKFQTVYLTSSLIRETVNSVLIEHGYEEYRNKLARLGMPVSDIVEMLDSIDSAKNGIDNIISKSSQSIFSEYLLINTLPKDIADMHLAGEINISHTGIWGLLPDTIFLNITDFSEDGLNPKGKLLDIPRFASFHNYNDFVIALPILISLLSREASTEIVLDGVVQRIVELTEKSADIGSVFSKALMASTASQSHLLSGLPLTTIPIPMDDLDEKVITLLIDGYTRYVHCTPIPRIGLALEYNTNLSDFGVPSDIISSAVCDGGIMSVSRNGLTSSLGIRKSLGVKASNTVIALQSLSINLPRLAYQSNRDETYFRARLAMMLKPALVAMSIRKKTITGLVRKGIIPLVASSTKFVDTGTTNLIINLVGAKESVYDILGQNTNDNEEILQKVLRTAVDVARDQGRQLGEDNVGIAMINDNSASRFANLDSDRYGRNLISPEQNSRVYSHGIVIDGNKLLMSGDSTQIIGESNIMDKLLNGGLSVNIDVSNLSSRIEIKNVIESASELQHFRLMLKTNICNTCGDKSTMQSVEKCKSCNSPSIHQIYS